MALAEQVIDGRRDLHLLARLPDDDVLLALQRVPGIGPLWHAYLTQRARSVPCQRAASHDS